MMMTEKTNTKIENVMMKEMNVKTMMMSEKTNTKIKNVKITKKNVKTMMTI